MFGFRILRINKSLKHWERKYQIISVLESYVLTSLSNLKFSKLSPKHDHPTTDDCQYYNSNKHKSLSIITYLSPSIASDFIFSTFTRNILL